MSFDFFFACAAYRVERIAIPLGSRAVIALSGSLFLAVSLCFSGALSRLLPAAAVRLLGAFALLAMGVMNLAENALKSAAARVEKRDRPLTVRLCNFAFVLTVYADNTRADADRSKRLSAREALYLAIPLSIDSLVTGLGIQTTPAGAAALLGFSFACGMAAATLGTMLGAGIAARGAKNKAWLGGIILVALAIFKMFP